MAYIACDVCGVDEIDAEGNYCRCTKCDHIRPLFKEKEAALHAWEQALRQVQDSVKRLLKKYAQNIQDGTEYTTVKTEDLIELWDTSNACHYDSKTAVSFISEMLAEGKVLVEASDLFRSKARTRRTRHKATLEDRFNALREAVIDVHDFHGWENNFDLTGSDIIEEAYAEYSKD